MINAEHANILAIDPGKNAVGICEYMDGEYYASHFNPADYNEIYLYITSCCGKPPAFDFVAIEEQAYNANQSAKLGEVYGVIKAAIQFTKIPYVEVNVQTWKSIMGFRYKKTKKADKMFYMQEANRIAPVELKTIDEVDAFMILRAVQYAMVGNPESKVIQGLAERLKKAVGEEVLIG